MTVWPRRARALAGASVSASFSMFWGAAGARPDVPSRRSRRDFVVLSHRLWATRFGSDPSLVGRSLTLNGRPRLVLGVMPADFFWPSITAQPSAFDGPDFWTSAPANDVPEGPVPTGDDFAANRTTGFLRLVARLTPDATRASAQAELTSVARDLAREYPATDEGTVSRPRASTSSSSAACGRRCSSAWASALSCCSRASTSRTCW
jgi:putative ABC transport system permease protein